MAPRPTEAAQDRLAALLSDVVAVGVELAMGSAAEVGLTLSQFRALAIVDAHAPMRLTALAEALGVAPSSATQICDRLAAAGLLERTRDGQNQRVLQLRLSNDGQAAVLAVRTGRSAQVARILDAVPEPSRHGVLESLELLSAALGRPAGTPSMFGW